MSHACLQAPADADPGALHDTLGIQRADPTGTKTLREHYRSQLHKRLRVLKRVAVTALADDDILGAGGQANTPERLPVPDLPAPREPQPGGPGPIGRDWTVADFLGWFESAQRRVLFGSVNARNETWIAEYVRRAYRKGSDDANTRARQVGLNVAANQEDDDPPTWYRLPTHQQALSAVVRRNREALDDVGAATREAVGQILREGVEAGHNPRRIARSVADRIDSIGMHRAHVHARTVVVGAYNEAALNRYEQLLGSDGEVAAVVEFATARDSRVCEECAGLHGRRYTVSDARGVIPVHPQCRCAWIPLPGRSTPVGPSPVPSPTA